MQSKGIVSLAAACGAIMLFWLAVLPWIAEQPPMKTYLNWLEDRKIDPSAMYYTELDLMDEILMRQQSDRGQSDSSRSK